MTLQEQIDALEARVVKLEGKPPEGVRYFKSKHYIRKIVGEKVFGRFASESVWFEDCNSAYSVLNAGYPEIPASEGEP